MCVCLCVFAALSYNFAIDQYHPLVAKKGIMPSPFLDEKGHPKEFIWQAVNEDELQGLFHTQGKCPGGRVVSAPELGS